MIYNKSYRLDKNMRLIVDKIIDYFNLSIEEINDGYESFEVFR
jgi:hypothetical protein